MSRWSRAVGVLVPAGVDRRGILVLSTGHVAADLFQGSVAALVPFLIRDRGYTYAAAGALFLMASLGSSLVQPLLGIYADRVRASWLMPAGLFLAAAGFAVCGLVDTYALTAAALLAGGFGVAAFHPEAVRYATFVSAARRGTGMSIFAVGGAAGFALGPILTTPVVLVFGLEGTPVIGAVILAAGVTVLVRLPYLERFRRAGEEHLSSESEAPSRWGHFSLASSAGVCRAVIGFGLQVFVPSYVVAELASTEAVGNAAIATMLVTTALGTIVGGRLADRHGFRTVVVWSLALGIPLTVALPLVGLPGAFVLMALIGLVEGANFYPLLVLAQKAIPRHLGLAAGVVLGLAIGVGAGVTALLGLLGDAQGLDAVLWAIAGFATLGLVLALPLPGERRPAPSPAPVA